MMATATPPVMEPIPLESLPGKRELSQHPSAIRARAERAAKRAGGGPRRAPKRRTARKPSSATRPLRQEIGGLLVMLNSLVIMSPLGTRPVEAIADSSVPAERVGDELDAVEIDALAAAIDAQCRRSPRIRKYVEGFLNAGAGGQILAVVGIIAARRAARHGLAPAELDFALGMTLGGEGVAALMEMEPVKPPESDPETGETAPARFDFDAEALIDAE